MSTGSGIESRKRLPDGWRDEGDFMEMMVFKLNLV